MSIHDLDDRLLTCADLMRVYGLARHSAEALMRNVPKTHVPGLRRVFVRRSVVEDYLASWTRS
jgi:hypothetical protein